MKEQKKNCVLEQFQKQQKTNTKIKCEVKQYQQTKLELDRVCCRFHVSHSNDLLFLCSARFKRTKEKNRRKNKNKNKKRKKNYNEKKQQQTFHTYIHPYKHSHLMFV